MISDPAKAASDVLLSLARAGRSFLLYDPGNEAIRGFLEDYRDSWQAYARAHGDLDLTVQPFEFLRDGQVVYLERDRERSLAFKMFRDGVRKLTIQEGITWEELTRLLQILSIRFVGVRLQEDDILTLLWKASFANIQVEAVEGFVPVDDEDEIAAAASGAALSGLGVVAAGDGRGASRAPLDFDLPAPELPDAVETFHREIPEDRKEMLREEILGSNVADEVLALCRELLDATADPIDLMSITDCGHFLRETREFLLSEDDLSQLISLNRLLAAYSTDPRVDENSRKAAQDLMEGFTSERATRKLLASIDRNANSPPPELLELLSLHPSDPLPTLLDVLAIERTGQPRRMARMLVESYLPERVNAVLKHYRTTTDEIAADLLRILAAKAPEAVHELFNELVHAGSRAEKLEFLNQAGSTELDRGLRSFLTMLLDDGDVSVRLKTLEVIASQGEGGAYPILQRLAGAKAKDGAEERELEAIGMAMARVNPTRSLEDFVAWALPKGFFHKLKAQTGGLRRAAVAGLVTMSGDVVESTLRKVARAGEDDIAKLARLTLRKRGTLADPLAEPGTPS